MSGHCLPSAAGYNIYDLSPAASAAIENSFLQKKICVWGCFSSMICSRNGYLELATLAAYSASFVFQMPLCVLVFTDIM